MYVKTKINAAKSLLPPGTSLLRRSAKPAQNKPDPEPVSLIKPPPPSSMSGSLTELERSNPKVSIKMWERILGRNPEDSQSDIEYRILKKGVHAVKRTAEYCTFLG